ncbi:hypothetical protein EDB85DRAFT_1894330 [Lactarius pseudohatsudake]|nr:hypothetical protein EDB85DRAFT_1894330 [Lactarius pseudohatsudake]
MDRSRSRSFQKREKNRTGPDFQSLVDAPDTAGDVQPRRSERNAKGKAPARADVDASDGSGDVEMGEAVDNQKTPKKFQPVKRAMVVSPTSEVPAKRQQCRPSTAAKAAKAAGRLLNSNYNVEECKPQADAPKSYACALCASRKVPCNPPAAWAVALKKALKEAAKVKLEAKNRKRSTTSIMEELPVTLEGLQERLDSMEAEAIAFQDTSEANTKASMSSATGFDISQLSIAAPLARVASGSGAGNTLTPDRTDPDRYSNVTGCTTVRQWAMGAVSLRRVGVVGVDGPRVGVEVPQHRVVTMRRCPPCRYDALVSSVSKGHDAVSLRHVGVDGPRCRVGVEGPWCRVVTPHGCRRCRWATTPCRWGASVSMGHGAAWVSKGHDATWVSKGRDAAVLGQKQREVLSVALPLSRTLSLNRGRGGASRPPSQASSVAGSKAPSAAGSKAPSAAGSRASSRTRD